MVCPAPLAALPPVDRFSPAAPLRPSFAVRFIAVLRYLAVLLTAAASSSALAQAQAYPSRPVRVVVGQPPGGVQDTLARAMTQELTKEIGRAHV